MAKLTPYEKQLLTTYAVGIADTVGKAIGLWLYRAGGQRSQQDVAVDFGVAAGTISRELQRGNLSFTRFACLLVRDQPKLSEMPTIPKDRLVCVLGALHRLTLDLRAQRVELPDKKLHPLEYNKEKEVRELFTVQVCCYVRALRLKHSAWVMAWDDYNSVTSAQIDALTAIASDVSRTAESDYNAYAEYTGGRSSASSAALAERLRNPIQLRQVDKEWMRHLRDAVKAKERIDELGRYRLP